MLVTRNALERLVTALERVAGECARLAEEHRATPIAGRTLLRQAVPTTFGLKAAGWLTGVLEARRGLVRVRDGRLAAQLGGAAGTLAALGDDGPEVARLYAEKLGLENPRIPWHTNRVRVAEVGAALAIAAGALAKVAVDVALLGQTEVGEATESDGGASSTMPQKRNPVGSALAVASARHVEANAGVLLAALPQEHERALGAWHSEWAALSAALAFTGGTADGALRALDGLEVDAERMRANLELSDGLVMAERASYLLAPKIGRREAYERVAEAAAGGRPRAAALDLDAADLAPATYLGSAEELVGRALAAFREDVG
jgi:3-carboxy-cis,cis-muconate cycloisomerase